MSKLQDPVLVVDDEADIRDLMEMTLMKMGLRVQTAVGVEDAKDKLNNNDYWCQGRRAAQPIRSAASQ